MPIKPNPDIERVHIRQTLNGSARAFSQLVHLYQGDLRIFLRRIMPQSSIIDDVAQEAFLNAYKNLSKFKFESSFKTWLFRIAYNQAQNEIRRHKINNSGENLDLLTDKAPDPSRIYEAKKEVEKMLSILTVEQRKVLSLSFGSGFSHEEISNILDMPLGTVKSHALRGKEKALEFLHQSDKMSIEHANE